MRRNRLHTQLNGTHFAFVVALIGCAYALLTLTLTLQSLWLDEVYSLFFVSGTFAEAWQKSIWTDQNPHASLYYLSLWAWVKPAGQSDFALRYLSVCYGLLSLALAWRLTRDWFDAPTATHITLLMSIAPYGVWYAQEARQYALYLALSLLSMLCLSRWQTQQRWPYALAYALSATAMAYAHFFSLIIIALQWLVAFGFALIQRRQRGAFVLIGCVIALLCSPIPLKLLASEHTRKALNIGGAELSVGQMLQELIADFALRTPIPSLPEPRTALLLGLGALTLLGVWAAFRRNPRAASFLLGVGLAPAFVFLLVSIQSVSFTPRYIIFTYVAVLMALALGLGFLRQRARAVGWVAALACLGLLGSFTWRDLTNPGVQRENWRFTGQYLNQVAQPNDVIITFADYIAPVLQHYYTGPATVLPFSADPYNPTPVFDAAQQQADRTLWVVLSHDKNANATTDHKILDVAYARYPWSYAQYPTLGNIRVLGFSLRWRYAALPPTAQPISAKFQNGLELVGFKLDRTRLPAADQISHPPSNWIHVVTYWRRWKDISPTGAQPALRLVSSDGNEWGGDLSRRPNVFDFDPPEKWATQDTQDIVEAHADVNLNPITPTGNYKLEVRLQKDEQRLPRADAEQNFIPIADVEIVQ